MAPNEYASGPRNPGPEISFDVSVPNVARIYDYLLGGKDNFAADRDAAGALLSHIPDAQRACYSNRGFLQRAVRFLAADAGICQFIDIGTGLPTRGNVHEIAQEVNHTTRVAYVDNDPVVISHARALLATSPGVAVVNEDLRNPGAILGSPALKELIDFDDPVAVLLVAVTHFLTDDELYVIDQLKDAIPSGSYLVLSHISGDEVAEKPATEARAIYERASARVFPRSRDAINRLFHGMELVKPGLVSVDSWRPALLLQTIGWPDGRTARRRTLIYAGVAKKPQATSG